MITKTKWLAAVAAVAALGNASAARADSVERMATSLTDTLQSAIDLLPEDVTNIRLGIGPALYPAYEGSDDYKVNPVPVISLRYKNWIEVDNSEIKVTAFNKLFSSGSAKNGGMLKFGPLVSVNFGRSAGDSPDLAGTGKVGTSFELGAFVSYTINETRIRLRGRQDVASGHNGAKFQLDLSQTFVRDGRFTMGGNLGGTFVTAPYMRSFFGINAVQAAASGLPIYTPGSGFKDGHASAYGTYAFTAQWSVYINAGYERLLSKAKRSPLVAIRGTPNQFDVGGYIIYSF